MPAVGTPRAFAFGRTCGTKLLNGIIAALSASNPNPHLIFALHDRLNMMRTMRIASKKLVREMMGDEPYESYAVGRYVVIAPGRNGRG